jgi:hypothetical protein
MGTRFEGENARIELAWSGNHTLQPNECYQVILRWTEDGETRGTSVCMQSTSWFVDKMLWLRADQATGRVYNWSVRLARKDKDTTGAEVYVPLGPPSAERAFSWN